MKKILKVASAFAAVFAAASFAFAEVPENWAFSLGVDAAYAPASEKITGNLSDHFAPITGAYSGLEGRINGEASYTIATPLGDNWLLNSANLVLGTALELTPVSIKPQLSATFTPLPFLVFSGGVQGGTGWDAGPFKGGLCLYDETTASYLASTPFKTYFYKWWAQGTFQFDTGAVFQGDWTHVVMQYSYQVYYEGCTAAGSQDIWEWQCGGNRVNGLRNYQSGILAYQMPLTLYRVGVMYESDGYYKDSAFANEKYDGNFKEISISPLSQIKFNEHNMLSVLAGFSSRRCFEKTPEGTDAATGWCISREWYFKRVAFSYTYTF